MARVGIAAWRDISTAPKDPERRILLAKIVTDRHVTGLWWATMGSWSKQYDRWWDGIEPAGLAGATHWLPADSYGVGVD